MFSRIVCKILCHWIINDTTREQICNGQHRCGGKLIRFMWPGSWWISGCLLLWWKFGLTFYQYFKSDIFPKDEKLDYRDLTSGSHLPYLHRCPVLLTTQGGGKPVLLTTQGGGKPGNGERDQKVKLPLIDFLKYLQKVDALWAWVLIINVWSHKIGKWPGGQLLQHQKGQHHQQKDFFRNLNSLFGSATISGHENCFTIEGS